MSGPWLSQMAPIRLTSANVPAASSVAVGTEIFVSDFGLHGAKFRSNGTRWVLMGGALDDYYEIAAPVTSDGSSTETVQVAIPMPPAWAWRPGDKLRIALMVTKASASDTNTCTLRIGTSQSVLGSGAGFSAAQPATTNLSMAALWEFRKLSATSIQPTINSGSGSYGASTAASVDITGLPNMETQTVYLQVTAKMTTGGLTTTTIKSANVGITHCGA